MSNDIEIVDIKSVLPALPEFTKEYVLVKGEAVKPYGLERCALFALLTVNPEVRYGLNSLVSDLFGVMYFSKTSGEWLRQYGITAMSSVSVYNHIINNEGFFVEFDTIHDATEFVKVLIELEST